MHALLGKVYSQTDRTQQAIAELKLAPAGDKDGTVHYQIARLYLKVGDRDLAKEAFALPEQMQKQGLARASIALQQGTSDTEYKSVKLSAGLATRVNQILYALREDIRKTQPNDEILS